MLRSWYGAGLVAGIAVFLWGGFAHMVLGLGGESTMKQIPNEDATLAALANDVREPGLYMYPYVKDSAKMSEAIRTRPYGLLIYSPPGRSMDMGAMLAKQAASDILACLTAAWLLTFALPMLPKMTSRICFVAGLGVFSFLVSEVPYWNWYRFPGDFTMFALAFKCLTWALAGGILGYLMQPAEAPLRASMQTA